VTEHRVTVNGVTLFTRLMGEGPPTIVLHGGPGAHHDYLLPQYDALAVRRSLLYYDQRGGGRSPTGREAPLGWEAHVADLDALRRHWRIPAAALLGYSWGGLLAMLYALRHSDAVSQLTLVCPAPARAADRRRFEAAFTERSRAPGIAAAREALQQSGLRTTDPDAYRQRLFELSVTGYFHDPDRVRDLTPFRVTGRTQQAVWDSLGGYDLEADLRGLRIPSLVLAGRHDPMPLDSAERSAAALGAAMVVFENSGHCPHVEEPERFTAVLDAWLPREAA
jgi:proline iminopeptidase